MPGSDSKPSHRSISTSQVTTRQSKASSMADILPAEAQPSVSDVNTGHTLDAIGSSADQQDQGKSEITLDKETFDNLIDRIEILEFNNSQKDAHIKLIYSKLDLLQKENKRQEEQQNDLTVRSMNQNIVLSGKSDQLKEPVRGSDDDCKRIVETILHDCVKIRDPSKVIVIRAHRLGYNNSGKSRPIVARLATREMVGEVMKRCGQLAGLDIFINPQYPPIIEERRSYIQDYRKKSKSAGAEAKVSVDRLFVNNELRRDLLTPTIPPAIPPSIPDFPKVKVGKPQSNDFCRITLASVPTQCLDDVGAGLDALLLKSPNTPHSIVYAYRHAKGDLIYRNYDSGLEPGIGSRILKMLDEKDMRNYTVILYMWYKRSGKMKGPNFYDMVQVALDELVT